MKYKIIDLNLLIKIQVVGIYYSFWMLVFNDKMITISNLLNAWLILNTKAGLERQEGEQSEVVERNNKRVKTMRDTPPTTIARGVPVFVWLQWWDAPIKNV